MFRREEPELPPSVESDEPDELLVALSAAFRPKDPESFSFPLNEPDGEAASTERAI